MPSKYPIKSVLLAMLAMLILSLGSLLYQVVNALESDGLVIIHQPPPAPPSRGDSDIDSALPQDSETPRTTPNFSDP